MPLQKKEKKNKNIRILLLKFILKHLKKSTQEIIKATDLGQFLKESRKYKNIKQHSQFHQTSTIFTKKFQ